MPLYFTCRFITLKDICECQHCRTPGYYVLTAASVSKLLHRSGFTLNGFIVLPLDIADMIYFGRQIFDVDVT